MIAKVGKLRARAKVGRKAWFKGRCVVQAHRVRESTFVRLNPQDDVANDRAGLDCTVGVGDPLDFSVRLDNRVVVQTEAPYAVGE